MRFINIRSAIITSIIILLAFISFFAYQYTKNTRSETRKLITNQQSLVVMDDLMDDLQDIETAISSYQLSGNENFLNNYNAAANKVKIDSVAVKQLFELYPQRIGHYQKLLALVKQRIQIADALIASFQQQGGEQKNQQVFTDQGKSVMDEIRQLVLPLEKEDRNVIIQANSFRKNEVEKLSNLFGVLASFFILFTFLFFWQLKKRDKQKDADKKRIEYLANMVEQSGEAIISTDTKFIIVSWNKGAEALYDYSKAEALGQIYHILLKSTRTDQERKQVVEILKVKGFFIEELEYIKKNNQSIYIQASYSLLKNKNEITGCTIVHRNITDKKLSEQLLTEFNQKLNKEVQQKTAGLNEALDRFNIIANATNDVVWDADLRAGGTVWWNDKFYEKFGYPKNENAANTFFWEDNLHPDDKDRVLDHINYVLKQTAISYWSDEYRLKKADGTYLDIYDRSYVMRDENNNAYRMIGSMADVTDLMHTRNELLKSEEKYRTLVEQATDAIFVTDTKGKFIVVNPAACKLSQFTTEELMEMTIYDFADKEDMEKNPFRFEDLQNGQNLITERLMRTKLNEPVLVESNSRLLSDGRLLVFIRDITEKRKAEVEIVQTNARFQMLTKATSDIIWDWNLADDTVWWNDNYYSYLGYKKTKEIVSVEDWTRQMHPDDAIRVEDKIREHIAGNDLHWNDEYQYKKADGTYLNFIDRGHIMRDKNGKAYRMIGSMVDITEQYKVKENLRESELRYRSLIEQASEAIIIYSENGEIHNYNNSAANMTGYTPEEFKDLRLQDILMGDLISNPGFEADIQAGKSVTVYQQLKKKNGSFIEIEISAKQLGDGKILAFGRDITERKKAEELIINNELRFRTLTSNAPVGIFQTDATGKTTYVNEAWLGFTQMTADEAIGDGWWAAIHPDDQQNLKKEWERRSAKKIPSTTVYRLLDKSGNIRWVSGNAVPLKTNNGDISGFIGTINDITAIKQVSEALAASEKNLYYVLAGASESFYVVDKNYHITLISSVAQHNLQKAWGHRLETGDNILAYMVPYKDEPIEQSLEKAFAGEKVEYELHVEIKDLPSWSMVNYIPVKDDNDIIIGVYISTKDITTRKEAEKGIMLSEQKYRTLVEQAIDAIALYDANGNMLDVNAGAENLLGYTKEELKKMTLGQILTPEDIQINPVRYDVLQSGMSTVKQRLMRKKDGTLVHTEVRSQQLADGRFLSVIRDMTERYEAQLQVKKEKELSDSIISSLPGVFYFFDQSGKFIKWNKQFETVTGYSTQEISRMHPLDFFIGDDQTHISNRISEVFEKGISNAEANFTTKAGEKIPYYFTGASIEHNGEVCLIGTGIDITLRKKAENALMESEEKYRLLFRDSPLPMWVFETRTLTILDVNEAALIHYGYKREEFMLINLLKLRPEKDEQLFLNTQKNYNQGLKSKGIWKHVKKDGTLIDVEINAHDIVYNNKPGRMVVAVDITDKLQYEKEIKQNAEQLRLLADHLNNIREEERTHIAREIHDELGQYLTVLKMDVSWLNKRIGSTAEKPVKDKIDDLLEMLDGTVKTVRRISSDLRPSLLDDLGLAAAIEWQLSEIEKRSAIKIKFKSSGDYLNLPEDKKTGLFRIFQESLTNVTRHAEAKTVHVSLDYIDKKFILRIADDGKGFEKRNIADKKTLGILGMKERTAMIGGTYKIVSSPGNGTTVLVTLPFEN